MNKHVLDRVLTDICQQAGSIAATVHVRDERLVEYNDEGERIRKDVIFLFHLFLNEDIMQDLFEGKTRVEVEEDLRDKGSDYRLVDYKSRCVELECLIKDEPAERNDASACGNSSHIKAILNKIGSSIAVPFIIPIYGNKRSKTSKTKKSAVLGGRPKAVLTLHFPSSNLFSGSFKSSLKDVATRIGSSLATMVGQVGVETLNSLHLKLIRTELTYEDKLDAICETLRKLVSDEPKGSYAHIRTFISLRSEGLGVLRMDSNAGYDKKAWQIADNKGRIRRVADSGKETQEQQEQQEKEKKSISNELFTLAYKKWKSSKATTSSENQNINELLLDATEVVLNKKKSRYKLTIESRDVVRSQLATPILDDDGMPYGTLVISSKEYGWLNCCWSYIITLFAKEACSVIMHEKGVGFSPNKNLKINPKIVDDTQENLLKQIYRDPRTYKKLDLTRLGGHGDSATFQVEISTPKPRYAPRIPHIVRFMPRLSAEQERHAYETRVKNFLGAARFSAKIGEAFTHDSGAFSYVMLGSKGGIDFKTLSDEIQEKLRNVPPLSDIERVETNARLIKAAIKDVFYNILRPWHTDGAGMLKKRKLPNIIELYERKPRMGGIKSDLAILLDTDRPGLFDRRQLENARENYAGKVGEMIDWYWSNQTQIAKKVKKPWIGLCHGDLNHRNILMQTTDEEQKPSTWIIDFDRVHRGHVLQDFTRLESYVQHLILGELDVSEIERILLTLDDILELIPGKEMKKEDKEKQIKKGNLNSRALHLLIITEEIRRQGRDLFDLFNKIPIKGCPANERAFALEYYTSLFCQYLDWASFKLPEIEEKKPESKKERKEHMTKVNNLAVASKFVCKHIEDLLIIL